MRRNIIDRNIKLINEKKNLACDRSNRKHSDVITICVSKSVSSEWAKTVVDLGITHLAENRIDNLINKQEHLNQFSQIKWHFIGHLQRRKVKAIINRIDYFHSLDRLTLAKEIDKRAIKPIKCFVQVNVSGELTKQGVSPEALKDFFEALTLYPNIKVIGLMTMAPKDADSEKLLLYFSKLKKCLNDINEAGFSDCNELSMGMSRDFEEAILCGATYIRVGTEFFIDVED